MEKIYELPLEAFEALETRISKLNKKYRVSVSTKVLRHSLAKGENGIEYPIVEFEVCGEKPHLGTHEVLAVKKVEGNHVLIFGPSAEDVPKKYWSLEENQCDHCSTMRSRKTFLILRNFETGEILQVGKTCVKEYTNSLEEEIFRLYRVYALYREAGQFNWDGYIPSSGYIVYDVRKYLAIASKVIASEGYVSSDEAFQNGELSTKQNCCSLYDKFASEGFPEEFGDVDKVNDIISWWLGKNHRDDDAFWQNVAEILKDGYCREKFLGLVTFLPNSYENYLERIRNMTPKYDFLNDYPTGMAVGDKVSIEVVLRKRSYYETNFSYYGQTVGVYLMSDREGHCFLWKTGAATMLDDVDLASEQPLLLSGKIKEFSEYKGVKQTVLLRCKVKPL